MKLAEILRPDHPIPLSGGSLPPSLLQLFDAVDDADEISDPVAIRDRLERIGSEDLLVHTDRGFLVHIRSDSVSSVMLVVGIGADAICRELGDADSQCARLLFLLIAPSRRAAEHIQLVGALGRLLAKPGVSEDLLAVQDPEALRTRLRELEIELPPQLRVRDVMSSRPKTTTPEATLREAAREMVRSGLGGMIAVDADARIVGMLGERELMRDLLNNYLQAGTAQRDAPASTGRRKVRDVMTRQVLGVSPDQPLSEVASLMVNKDVERVPIVEEGRLIGVLTRADIVRKLIGY